MQKRHSMRSGIKKSVQSAFIRVLFLCLLPAAAFAQSPVAAAISADRHTLTVGDPVVLTLHVTHPPGATALPPDIAWEPFELLATAVPTPTPTTTTFAYTVTLWAPGDYTLPAIPLTLHYEDGDTGTAVTNPLTFTVASVLTPDDRELRDIRPQAALHTTPPRWTWLLLLGVAVGGGALAWRLRRAPQQSAAVPVSGAQQEALAALDAAAAQRGVALATAVLHILRRFLQRVYAIPTDTRTSAELVTAVPAPRRPALQALLHQIDAARFGRAPVHPHALTTAAHQFIAEPPTVVRENG